LNVSPIPSELKVEYTIGLQVFWLGTHISLKLTFMLSDAFM